MSNEQTEKFLALPPEVALNTNSYDRNMEVLKEFFEDWYYDKKAMEYKRR